jgi:hypothetical protein
MSFYRFLRKQPEIVRGSIADAIAILGHFLSKNRAKNGIPLNYHSKVAQDHWRVRQFLTKTKFMQQKFLPKITYNRRILKLQSLQAYVSQKNVTKGSAKITSRPKLSACYKYTAAYNFLTQDAKNCMPQDLTRHDLNLAKIINFFGKLSKISGAS